MAQMKKITALSLFASGLTTLSLSPVVANADDSFYEALSGGKVGFSARARYESVDQDNALKDADAYTLRTTLSYKTGDFKGFKAFAEIEDITDLGDGEFNNKVDGDAGYSVVADPDDTEVNQAYLQYNGFDTEFKFGRQEVTYRKAPFHRFVGTVLWRQNHQSHDAFTIVNKSLADTTLSYAYLGKKHTILGGTVDTDSHLVNLKYTGLPIGDLEGYGYFLEDEDTPATATQTIGLRLSGAQPVNDEWKVIYTVEYAKQGDYEDGTMADDQNYYLGEIGAKYKGWLAKFSYEMQEGDGTSSFKTPLGTNHAFQGWADQFLSTPSQGLEDMYFTVVGKVLGAKVIASYHDFETDQGGIDAGDELDILVAKKFAKHYTVGMKFADYDAGDSSLGKVDTKKFWLWGQVKF
jgi:hypothetical protein